jgi:hypothetical protein
MITLLVICATAVIPRLSDIEPVRYEVDAYRAEASNASAFKMARFLKVDDWTRSELGAVIVQSKRRVFLPAAQCTIAEEEK